jgi:hypothetical protein
MSEAAAVPARPGRERFFSAVIDGLKDANLAGRGFVRTLFKNCTLQNVRRAHFANCTFDRCSLEPRDVRDLVGATLTLDCAAFNGLKFNALAIDSIIFLLSRAASEEDKARLLSIMDPQRVKLFEKIFPELADRP